MKKNISILFLLLSLTLVQSAIALTGPDEVYNRSMGSFRNNAYCKISPQVKVLLSLPQDRDYEKKYITDDEQILRIQCERGLMMDVYLQTEAGIIKTSQHTESSFPACEALTVEEMDGGSYWMPRNRDTKVSLRNIELLIPGTILVDPLVLTKDYNIMNGNYSLTEETSLPPSKMEKNIVDVTDQHGNVMQMEMLEDFGIFFRAPTIHIAHLPECAPNMGRKK